MKKILLILSLSIFIFSCIDSQNTSNQEYKIDAGLTGEIKEQASLTNGVSMGKMEVKMFENDSLIVDTYDKEKKIEFITMSNLGNDTIRITGFAGMFAGFGFYLDISNGGYDLTCLAKSDVPIYKYNEQDTTLSFGLSVPCYQTSLTLTAKPIFENGETISGYLELKSNDFWEESNGESKKYKMELRAYFRTEELKSE
jgi:hypothetical protein